MTLEERDLIKSIVAVSRACIDESNRRGVKVTMSSEDMAMLISLLDDICNRLWIAENNANKN